MSEMSDFLSKLDRIDRRWLYAFTIILVIIPIVSPLGLPVKVSKPTRDFYNVISSLPEGSVVVYEEGSISGQYDVTRAACLATFKLIFSYPVKFIAFCDSADGPVLLKDMLSMVDPESYGKEYGEDYVIFGLAPGGETATASFATDIRKTYSTDLYGTPIDEIPLMSEINSAENVDLIIQVFVGCYNCDWVVRQWVVPYNTKYLGITSECCTPMIAAYYPASCKAYLPGTIGATEMEILARLPGEGATVSDAKNLGLIPMILFIILGNIAYFRKRFGKEEEK
jgi:hypothetical protein